LPSPDEPKLTVSDVVLTPQPDGYYVGNVDLSLNRGPNNPQVGFRVTIQHARTLDEIYDKLKPAVDDLASELKKASENFHPPH
jgi:hypothetical protein